MSTAIFRFAVTALLVGGAFLPAHAQVNSYDLTISQTLQTMDLSNRLQMLRQPSSGRAAGRDTGASTRTTATNGWSGGSIKAARVTTFRPVADSIVPQEVARGSAIPAAQRQQVEHTYQALLASYKERLRQRNAPANDVSRAASFLISSAVYVHRNGRPLSERDFVAVKDQLHRVFLRDETFQSKGDRERQTMYENFAIVGAVLSSGFDVAKRDGNTRAIAELQQLARRQFYNVVGADIDNVRITTLGVEEDKRAR